MFGFRLLYLLYTGDIQWNLRVPRLSVLICGKIELLLLSLFLLLQFFS
jgi:hypothetical protein